MNGSNAPERKFIVHGIKVPLKMDKYEDYDSDAIARAVKKLNKSNAFRSFGKAKVSVYKKSVDARERNAINFVYSVAFEYERSSSANSLPLDRINEICKKENVTLNTSGNFEIPQFRGTMRPVVCGFGPCGMFAALILARSGARPIVIERGADADERVKIVEHYWKTGELSESTNVQFGEGGAGTFSDGKLMTRINDPLCSFVLETFAENGASSDILVNAKPHVGTDKLREIVKNIRKEIISLGGEVHFCTALTSLTISGDGKSVSIGLNGESSSITTDALFLAVGHSARDTFEVLNRAGINMCAKPFSVGLRIEHLQKNIDRSLYGDFAGHPSLSPGEYALSCRNGDRAAYTFCMCPGGTVVASSSEKDGIVTNGMSYSARDGINANCAVAVSVSVNDFGNDPFSAIGFQENIEKKAFIVAGGNGAAPIQTVGSFLKGTTRTPDEVIPTYTGKTSLCNLEDVFPGYVTDTLKYGLADFERKIKGFSSDSAVLTAPETRTSSPVKLTRDENGRSTGVQCIYTCGEGAGYAGGITSAAVDGIRSAVAYLRNCY